MAPKTRLVSKFPCLSHPPPTSLGCASFFGLSLPSMNGGQFHISPGKLPRCKPKEHNPVRAKNGVGLYLRRLWEISVSGTQTFRQMRKRDTRQQLNNKVSSQIDFLSQQNHHHPKVVLNISSNLETFPKMLNMIHLYFTVSVFPAIITVSGT